MLDNALNALLVTQMQNILNSNGMSSYQVVQKEQPTQQGIPSTPTAFYERLFDIRYGWPAIIDSPMTPPASGLTASFQETETQCVETHFQISALSIQDPTNLSLPTPADVVNLLAQGLNSHAIMANFQAAGVYVLRAQTIEQQYFEDDRTLIESQPAFTLILRHNRTFTTVLPGADQVLPGTVPGVPFYAGTFPI